jgi:hypothetical protein
MMMLMEGSLITHPLFSRMRLAEFTSALLGPVSRLSLRVDAVDQALAHVALDTGCLYLLPSPQTTSSLLTAFHAEPTFRYHGEQYRIGP